MRIGFDLDGVLYPWQEVVWEYSVNILNKKLSYEDFIEYILNPKNKLFLDNLIATRNLYFTRSPIKSVRHYIQNLGKQNNIYYITNRSEDLRIVTEAWLFQYKFPQLENLILTKDKSSIIRRLKIDIFVEDRAEIAIKIKNLTTVILYKQLWNKDVQDEFKYKIGYMEEFPKILEQIKGENNV